MPEPKRFAQRGNLQGINDRTVARELQKLWEHVEGSRGGVGYGNERFITLTELDQLRSEVITKIKRIEIPGFRQDFAGEAQQSSSKKGGGGGTKVAGAIYFGADPPADPTAWIAWWNSEEGALKVWYTPPGDPDSSQWVDAMPYRSGQTGATGAAGTSGGTSAECRGRLTLVSGTPVPTSDQIGATIIYWTPYDGDTIALYSGSVWTVYSTTEISLSLSGLTSGKNYDVFAYYTGSAVALELSAAWASDTARTDAITKVNGVPVKSADNTRRYLGTMRATASNTTEDSVAKRYVFNEYNRFHRHMLAVDGTATWTYSTATYRQANASAANQLDYVSGDASLMIHVSVIAAAYNSTATARMVFTGIGIDSTTVNSAVVKYSVSITNTIANSIQSHYEGQPGLGRHYIARLEKGGGTDTQTWYGANGVPSDFQTGIFGWAVM